MSGVWRERGFRDFIDGKFGNGGQNLYVSRAGVLQRIFQYDFDRDGYADLVFCNSQNHWERPPAYVYTRPLSDDARIELPSDGSWTGTVADLNGDGHDDLVLGMWTNGIRDDLSAFIYFGSPEGFSEREHLQLPAPKCRCVAAGDINGDGRCDLAFLLDEGLRVFHQTDLGFEPRRFVDLAIVGVQCALADLDGDGCADLVVRTKDQGLRVYWGSRSGLAPDRLCVLEMETEQPVPCSDETTGYAEYVEDAEPLASVIHLGGVPHLFWPRPGSVHLIPVRPDRVFDSPLLLDCRHAMAVAVGDVNGDGHDDLVFACREPCGHGTAMILLVVVIGLCFRRRAGSRR